MKRFVVTVIDLYDHTFEQFTVEAETPVDAYIATLDDVDEFPSAKEFYSKLVKDNPKGGWYMDMDEGMATITEVG